MHEHPIVCLTRDIPDAGRKRLAELCTVDVWPGGDPPPHAEIVSRVAELEADAIFCTVSDTIDVTVLDASPNLRTIGTMSVGYDHIDLDAARDRGISVGYTPGVLAETTADLAWSLLMAAARRIVEAHRYVESNNWTSWGPTVLLGRDIHDATLGVVGLGRIGTAFAKRAAGFDMDVIYAHTGRNEEAERDLATYGIDAHYHDLETVIERADFLAVHVPLRTETYHMIGEEELRAMPEEAILVNTARGEVVDTDALVTALEQGWIRHAALDVTDPEPIPIDHPLVQLGPERVTISPHIGSASEETRSKMAVMTAENILAGLDGNRPPYSALDDAGLERSN